jgi:endonuclease III
MGKPRSPRGRAGLVAQRLAEVYPGDAKALCELDHENPFQLLAATILSAQTTDVRVNEVTPKLFARYPDAMSLSAAVPEELEELIHSTGFFRAKAKSLIAMATRVCDAFDGEVPHSIENLTSLAGVGRKTANVVRSVAMAQPGLPVDTHVLRLSQRLRLTAESDPVKVEHDLSALVRPAERGVFSLRLILHGRRVCAAKKPQCEICVLADFCPSAGT